MFPGFALNYFHNRAAVHSMQAGKSAICAPTRCVRTYFSNLPDLGFSKLMGMLSLAVAFIAPPFAQHVQMIVATCAEKQMSGISAFGLIACVANHHLWQRSDCSPMENPRGTGSANLLAAPRAQNDPVAKFVFISNPLPTAISFYNLGPKSRRERFRESILREQFISNRKRANH